ncbi:MAG: TVP38/TMEM64 family protein [Solirubrobacterales bacterium]
MSSSDYDNPDPAARAEPLAGTCSGRLRRWGREKRRPWLAAALAVVLVGGAVWSYFSGGIVSVLLARGVSADQRIERIQAYFDSFGVAAPLAYLGLVTIEVVVAPIPGLMLYAPGGMVFGGFWGGLLSLLGNTAGAGIACGLIRALGGRRFASWLEQGRLGLYHERLSTAGLWLILLLRANPLTSSDLVSYAAGLAGIPVWKVMAGTLLGMAPLCWAQAYFCDGMLRAIPQLVYPMIALCAIYAVVVVWVIGRMGRNARNS